MAQTKSAPETNEQLEAETKAQEQLYADAAAEQKKTDAEADADGFPVDIGGERVMIAAKIVVGGEQRLVGTDGTQYVMEDGQWAKVGSAKSGGS